MDFQEYIKAELLILIPVLYIIGIGLKKSDFSNNKIPIILGISSVVLSSIWVFSTSDIMNIKDVASAIFTSITQGVLLAGASVYINQLYIQRKKDDK